VTYRVQTPTTDEVIETFPTTTNEEIENTVIGADEASKWPILRLTRKFR